ncbi:hypothetical protein Rsub_05518 [Raphidocelis subcapitata]|uniref:Uncharacterized protein n=1 Tax=Raphidocelis subcapitata TaxID=307507 RepID=A0A2V0NXG4_9CHLO|nr:hypothetical protein Rsub_05518 [Raphidocelis subcapitata]|eukprot:GBF92316.1 hypothetical protein Rsub_05518 [Raphidocelis subcapitata]
MGAHSGGGRAAALWRRLPPDYDAAAAAFFFTGVAFKCPWTAISSLSQITERHGPRALLLLNLAYFVPPMPLLALLSALQRPIDRALGVRRSAQLRLTLGLGGLAALSLAFPRAAAAPGAGVGGLLALTAAIGSAYALAFGTSYQLAPLFGAGCTVGLTAGFVSAGGVVLFLDFAIRRGRAPYYTQAQLHVLFAAVAAACLAGLAASLALIRAHARRLETLGTAAPRGSGAGAVDARGAAFGGGVGSDDGSDGEGGGGGGRDGGAWPGGGGAPGHALRRGARRHHHHHSPVDVEAAVHVSAGGGGDGGESKLHGRGGGAGGGGAGVGGESEFRAIATAIAPAALALLASVGTSMAAFPFFAYLPTNGALGPWVAQAAFYARMGGDVAGRIVPPQWQARSRGALVRFAALKAALLPPLLAALLRPGVVGGDFGAVALVAVNWALSGYVNTGAYLVAPTLVSGAAQRARVGGVMATAFQASCLAGLLAAGALQALLHAAGGAPPAAHSAPAAGGGPAPAVQLH